MEGSHKQRSHEKILNSIQLIHVVFVLENHKGRGFLMNQKKHVMISGGGVAGLCLALFLRKAGISTAVYEGFPYYKDTGASVEIAPSGVRVLRALGLEKVISKNSHAQTKVKFCNNETNEEMSFTRRNEANFGEQAIYINRPHLLSALIEALRFEGIEVQYGKRLKAFQEEKNGIIAYFDDQSTLREQY